MITKKTLLPVLFIFLIGCVPQQLTSMPEANVLTQEQAIQKFHQLQCGMTFEQIKDALGKPTQIMSINTDLASNSIQGSPLSFDYRYSGYKIRVDMHNLEYLLLQTFLYDLTTGKPVVIKKLKCTYTPEQIKQIKNKIANQKQTERFMNQLEELGFSI